MQPMSERRSGLYRLLAVPRLHLMLRSALGRSDANEVLMRDHVRPVSGSRVLDLGCGAGGLRESLGDVDYTGVDLEASYVEQATERFRGRGRFMQGSACDPALLYGEQFDLVLLIALLHHLDDDQADAAIGNAARLLRPGGRLVTLDNAWIDRQSLIARALISRDRGRNVRRPEGYRAIIERHFPAPTQTIRHDLLRVPYTLVIFEAVQPQRG